VIKQLAKGVRLVFHDCGGNNHKCDGCLDLNNANNNGLQGWIYDLEPIYQRWWQRTSRADVWSLAGHLAAVWASKNAHLYWSHPWAWGRTDCPSSPVCQGCDSYLPDAEKGWDQSDNTFVRGMGMNYKQVSALMGAHSLGRTHYGFSGLDGPWDTTPYAFDVGYYYEMLNSKRGWYPTHLQSGKWLWGARDGSGLIMLNTDMAFLMEVYYRDGEPNCGWGQCPASRLTSSYLSDYANKPQYWLDVYQEAWDILITLGCSNLHFIGPNYQGAPVYTGSVAYSG